jgi:OOP family OmpA-OmpF porin
VTPDGTIDDLRSLILGPERNRIDQLEGRPAISAESVGNVLPDALKKLTDREADVIGEILSPTIGAAVRKAVTDALAAIMQKMDEALDRGLSFQSIRWRVEAHRTGRPFGEIALMHALLYRVEGVFLVHPQTGLVLESATPAEDGLLNPDQIASMLEAIEAFVHDAFAPLHGTVHVGRIDFGEMFLWIDRSPEAAVVALVRGVAPSSFAELLRETRESIVASMRDELTRFRTDVAPFGPTRPKLEACLKEERKKAPSRAKAWLSAAAAILVLGGALLAAHHHERITRERHALDASVAALTNEPGIVVTEAERTQGRLHIRGLRDPLAPAATDVLASHRLPAADVQLAPYSSLAPPIVEARAREKLAPGPGVTLQLTGEVLRAKGVAPQSWIARARDLAPLLAGVSRYDDSELRAQEVVDKLRTASDALEHLEVFFPVGSSDIALAAGLGPAVSRALEIEAAADDLGSPLCVNVVGHTDPRGTDTRNQLLSEARARAVGDALAARGVEPRHLHGIGAGVWRDGISERRARGVTFEIGPTCTEGGP